MPINVKDPRTSDRWFGPGAIGRYLPSPGGYSQLYDINPAARYSWRGLNNLLARYGEPTPLDQIRQQQEQARYQPPPFASGEIGVPLSKLTGGGLEQFVSNLDRPVVMDTGAPHLSLFKIDTPTVRYTGGYTDPRDFDPRNFQPGQELLTPAEFSGWQGLGNASELYRGVKESYWGRQAEGLGNWFEGYGTVASLGLNKVLKWALTNPFGKEQKSVLERGIGLLDAGAEFVERELSLNYQARFDPDLQEIINKYRWQGPFLKYTDPESYAKLQAAREAGHMFWETIAPPRLGVANTFRYVLGGLSFEDGTFESLSPDDPRFQEYQQFKAEYEQTARRQYQHWMDVFQGQPTEVGGLPALVDMRTKILENPGDAEQIYYDYLSGMGPLAFRSQYNDAVMHVVLDPLNVILPYFKPVERLQAARRVLMTQRVDPNWINVVDNLAETVTRVGSFADEAEAAANLARVEELAKATQSEELIGLANRIKATAAAGGDVAQDVTRMQDALALTNQLKRMSPVEQKLWQISGGDPFAPVQEWKGIKNIAQNLANMQASLLTPASRAYEFSTQVIDNLNVLLNNSDRIEDWARLIKQAAMGAFSGEVGHAVVSPVGRHIQGVLKAIGESADNWMKIWTSTENWRNLARAVATYTGQEVDIHRVIKLAQGSAEDVQSLLDLFADGLRAADDLNAPGYLRAIENGEITAETIQNIGKAFTPPKGKAFIPYTEDMMRAAVSYDAGEIAADFAVKQFGVKQKGWLGRFTDALKSVESLALLGGSAKYPIQNVMNNEVTLLARGLWNGMGIDDARNLWGRIGFRPSRAAEGFTIAGEMLEIGGKSVTSVEKAVAEGLIEPSRAEALRTIMDAMKSGGVFGKTEDLTRTITNKLPNFLNTRRLSSEFEAWSRERAVASGYIKAWDEYIWGNGKGFSQIDEVLPGFSEELRVLDPDAGQFVNDWLRNSRSVEDIYELLRKGDVRINAETWLREAAAQAGLSPQQAKFYMDHELFAKFSDEVAALANPTADDISRVIGDFKNAVERSLDDMVTEAISVRAEEFAQIARAEGPNGVMNLVGEMVDKLQNRFAQHAKMMVERVNYIEQVGDQTLARELWKALRDDSMRSWERTYKLMDAGTSGIETGLRSLVDELDEGGEVYGQLADKFRGGMDDFIANNRKFYEDRNKLWNTFGDEIAAGKYTNDFEARQARLQEIYATIDGNYEKLIKQTDVSWKKMDGLFEGLASNAPQPIKEAVYEWRRVLRNMRLQDMRDVQAFTKQARGAPEASAMWEKFWKWRTQAHTQEITKMEKMGKLIFEGNEQAITHFRMYANVPDDFTNIRMVDLLTSTVDNLDVIDRVQDIPGGWKLLDQLQASGNYDQALTQLREQMRIDAFDKMVDDVSALYEPGTAEHVEAVSKVANHFGVATATEDGKRTQHLRDIVNKWFRGDYTPTEAAPVARAATPPPAAPLPIFAPEEADQFAQTASALQAAIDSGDQAKMWQAFQDAGDTLTSFEAKYSGAQKQAISTLFSDVGYANSNDMDLAPKLQRLAGIMEGSAQRSAAEAEQVAQASARVGGPPAAPQTLGGVANIGSVPSAELEENLQGVIRGIANELHDELSAAEGVVRVPAEGGIDPTTGQVTQWIRASDNPQWYRDLYGQGYTSKKSFLSALRRIADGKDTARTLDQKYLGAVYDVVRSRLDDWAKAYPEVEQIMAGAPVEFVKPAAQYKNITDIPLNEVARALRDRAIFYQQPIRSGMFSEVLGGLDVPRQGFTNYFIPDMANVVRRENILAEGLEDVWAGHTADLVSRMQATGLDQLRSRPLQFFDLPAEQQGKLKRYLDHVAGQMRDAQVTAGNIAYAMADSAMLNYQRQYHWDAALSLYAPFAYWYTHSAYAWLIHSIDRPFMLGTFTKMQQFLGDAVGPRSNMPSRLRGRVRVNLPFIPPEMGDVYVDPLRALGSPFGSFFDPILSAAKEGENIKRDTEYKLQAMLNSEDITAEEYQIALQDPNNPNWQRARALVMSDQEANRFDSTDFINMVTSPHLPYQFLLNWKRKGWENALPVLPSTRTLKNVLGAMGVGENPHKTVWGGVREALGFHAYDQWDDYRVERELSTMVAEGGNWTVDQAYRAMIERQGDMWDEASRRVEQDLGTRGLYGIMNIPLASYPEGERNLRDLNEQFNQVMEDYYRGNPVPKDEFFKAHPEYELRLALWKEPEERLRQYVIDHLWDQYNNLPTLQKNQVREALGQEFADNFFNYQNYANIPTEKFGLWLKLMGGDPPGTLGDNAIPINLAPPDIAQRAQVFYDYRRLYFPNYWQQWGEYHSIKEVTARADFRAANPQIDAYWNWADGYLPNWREMFDAFMSESPDSQRDKFLQQYPELQDMWDQRKEIFPEYSTLSKQYALTPDYLKDDFRRAHPELVAAWDWMDQTLPNRSAYYDEYFALSDQSARDRFLIYNPRFQDFLNERDQRFPNISDLLKQYGQLPGNDGRIAYKEQHPDFVRYQNWYYDFLNRNPELAPYLSDSYEPTYATLNEAQQAQQAQPNFTWMEWQFALPSTLQDLLIDYYNTQEPLPEAAMAELEDIAGSMGLSYDELIYEIEGAYYQAVP